MSHTELPQSKKPRPERVDETNESLDRNARDSSSAQVSVAQGRALADRPERIGTRGFGRLLVSELGLILRRKRNVAGLVLLGIVPILMAGSIKIWGSPGERGPDFASMMAGNGLFVAVAALGVEITILLPLAIAMVAGDSIAGEANVGTLRYVLTVPVRRTRLLVVKYLAICIGALLATTLVAVVGIAIGAALFGIGPLITLSGLPIDTVPALGRIALVVAYLTVGLWAIGAIGLFLSTLTEQPIAAMVGLVLVIIMMGILGAVPQLDFLHPWLITDHWSAYADLLREPVDLSNIRTGLLLDAGYIAVFTLAAWARFTTKDITS